MSIKVCYSSLLPDILSNNPRAGQGKIRMKGMSILDIKYMALIDTERNIDWNEPRNCYSSKCLTNSGSKQDCDI